LRQLYNILSNRLLAAILAGLLLCMPAFAWGDSWGKSSDFEVQTTNDGLDSGSAEEWLHKGIELVNQGKYDQAIQAWDEAIKINPQYTYAWSNKGNILNVLGKYDEAIRACDQAIKINPQYTYAWTNKGNALVGQGRYDEALQAYDQAISINPQSVDAWNNKGNALYLLGKYDDAIKAFDRTISINPQYADAWYNKGVALYQLGMYNSAINAFDQATSLHPMLAQAWAIKGNAFYNLGKYDEAIIAYDQAIRINPELDAARKNRLAATRANIFRIIPRNESLEKNTAIETAMSSKQQKESNASYPYSHQAKGYKNFTMIIANETGFEGVKLVENESGKVITERTETEAQRQSSMDSSGSAPFYDDLQIYNIISTWKSNITNKSNGVAGKTATNSATNPSTTPRCICNSSGDQSYPVVGGNDQVGYYVAWMDNRSVSPDIYLYSLALEKEHPFAVGQYEDMYPDIDSDTIAWISRNPLNKYAIEDYWSIWAFNMSNASAKELLLGICNVAPISLRDDYLTYTDMPVRSFGTMIYKKLLHGVETAPTIPPSGSNPRSGGDIVVFQSHRNFQGYKNDSWDIYIWKQDGRPVPLQSDGYDQINPSTDGHTVVWQDNRSGNWDIYAYDLNSSREMQITNNQANQTHPDVDNGIIIWQDDRNGSWDLYAHDLKAKKERAICTDVGNQTQPRIRTGRIVWTDDRSGDRDIYLCKSPAV
jgi:beta propeller repeat protein